MPVLVRTLGYLSHRGGKEAKGLSKVKSHLKYLQYGKEHPNEPRGFSSDREEVTRAEFMAHVEQQPARGVIAHKLVFSLSQNEHDQLGVDMRQLVRTAMDDWSSRLGRPLNWIGFEHLDNGHPHVHVVVGGYAGEKQVGVYERDLRSLRMSSEREKTRQAELERAAPARVERQVVDKELARMVRELDGLLPRGRTYDPTRRPERSRDSDRGWSR